MGMTANLSLFDIPSTVQPANSTRNNCACSAGTGNNLVRAPYESEFFVQFQQAIQFLSNKCILATSPCSYGTPFEIEMSMEIDVSGTSSLTDTERKQAVEAFMRASNAAYAARTDNCQPEFRRLEQSNSHSFALQRRRRRHAEQDAPVTTKHGSNDNPHRNLQMRRMTMRLKTGGACNACTGKAHIGNRVDITRLTGENEQTFSHVPDDGSYGQTTHVQDVYDKSHCFCPLGSSVANEAVGRDTLTPTEELERIGSRIKNVTSMSEHQQNSTTADHADIYRLPDASTMATPPTQSWEVQQQTSDEIPEPPSVCPIVNLNFSNLVNPMARYYGQASTFQAGDYLYDQLWYGHGVKVSARVRNLAHADRTDLFIPKFIRGMGWVDAKENMTDRIRSSIRYNASHFELGPKIPSTPLWKVRATW